MSLGLILVGLGIIGNSAIELAQIIINVVVK